MNCYRYKQNGAVYDLFAKNKSKAKHYLRAITNLRSEPQFIGQVTNFANSYEWSTIAVTVPDFYLTPKEYMLKLIKDEFSRGEIDQETMEKDLASVRKWK
jgi:hypothetical protein